MLSQIAPTNDFDHSKQYSEATCKLLYKLIKYNDQELCCTKDSVIDCFKEIHNFFTTIPYSNWQMVSKCRQLPIKLIQMILARIAYWQRSQAGECLSEAERRLKAANNMFDHFNNGAVGDTTQVLDNGFNFVTQLIAQFLQGCLQKIQQYGNNTNSVKDESSVVVPRGNSHQPQTVSENAEGDGDCSGSGDLKKYHI